MTSERILVMEYAPGRRLGLLTPQEAPRIRNVLLRVFVRQILDSGVFHADPHPGNMLVHHDGRLVLLDCGAIDVLEPASRRELSRFGIALAMNRSASLCNSVIALSGAPPDAAIDRRRMQRDVEGVLEAASQGYGAAVIEQMFVMSRLHGLRLPPPLLALLRAIAILDGVLRDLDPGSDLIRDLRREFIWALGRRLLAAVLQPLRWLRARLRLGTRRFE
jgi:ubiquinone biosynthesis protein